MDEGASISGALSASDADLPAGASLQFATTASVSGFALQTDGSWSFDASGYDSLAAGEQRVLGIPVSVRDEQGASANAILTITITGTNDDPLLSAASAAVLEDASIGGQLSATDADSGAVLSYASSATVTGFTLNADGSWTFDASSYDSLAAGQQQVIAIPVTVTDEHGASSSSTLSITLTGTNDAPLLGAASAAVAEGASVGGQLAGSDVDNGAQLSYSSSATVTGFALNGDGSWSFDAGSYDSLAAGQQQVISIPVTVTDEHGATSSSTLTITVTGTNDAPVLAATSASVQEDASIGGQLAATDADTGAVLSYATAATVTGFTLGSDGNWGFDASSYDSLAAGQQQIIAIPVTVTDEHGATGNGTLTLTITGTNDAPVLSAASAGVQEDASIGGQLVATDVDTGAVLSYSSSASVTGFTLNADGNWSFDASSYDSLAAGQQQVIAIPVTVTDEHGATSHSTLTLTITGTNDAPVLAAASASVQEDASIGGQLAATDADTGAALSYATTATVNGFSLNADGSWSFDASSYDSLAPGQSQVISIPVTASDEHGATSQSTLTLTVIGSNDEPLVTSHAGAASVNLSVNENQLSVTTISGSDVDAGQTLSYAIAGGADAALFQINAATGALTFKSAPDFEAPADADGDNRYEVQVRVSDGAGGSALQTLRVQVLNLNEAPLSQSDSFARIEGSNGSGFGNVLANDSDPDAGSSLRVAEVASSAGGTARSVDGITSISTALGGTVVMNADGSFRYIAPVITHDTANTPQLDSFVYRASDGSSAGAWTTVSLSLSDTTPTAVGESATVAWGGSVSGNLLANDSGVDAPLAIHSVNVNGTNYLVSTSGQQTISTANGSFSVSANGSFSYTSTTTQTVTINASSENGWRAATSGLWGFNTSAWQDGSASKLSLSALASQGDILSYQGGSKPGMEVGNSGIQYGESMIIKLPTAVTSATLTMNQLNASQPTATWHAYDASGNLVGSGILAVGPANGDSSTQTFSTDSPFVYLRMSNALSGGQGYMVNAISYERAAGSVSDSISYTVRDADGDISGSATLNVTHGSSSSFVAGSPAFTAGSDSLGGSSSADSLSGGGGDDALRGLGGGDSLNGGSGNDFLDGGVGADTLQGGSGNDILVGGSGNDVFAWSLGDAGSAGAPAHDLITDFSTVSGTDALKLSDLLTDEVLGAGNTPGNLANYLHFTTDANGQTVLHISSTGGYSSGYSAGASDQLITFQGVDLRNALGLGASAGDEQIIQELLNRNKLIVGGP